MATKQKSKANVGKKPGKQAARRKKKPVKQSVVAPETQSQEFGNSYDENLLERTFTLWQFGDWTSLAKIEYDEIKCHPDRALLAIYLASAHVQLNNLNRARNFISHGRDWGCSKKRAGEVLVSGTYNTLGRSASLLGDSGRAQQYYDHAIKIGCQSISGGLISQVRAYEQAMQLGLFQGREHLLPGIDLEEICVPSYQKERPVVHTIHHMACTGGTLITKCLATQKNIFALSEVDPNSRLQQINARANKSFSPSDIISLLHETEGETDLGLVKDIFLSDVWLIAKFLKKDDRKLLLRDHPHSAYHTGDFIRNTPTLRQILLEKFSVRSIVTVRNPVDSYLSLVANKWLHFRPSTFEEYCGRYLKFLDDYAGVEMYKYEDFVADPASIMEKICENLGLEYSLDFISEFPKYNFSGDSGRKGDVIEARTRREYDKSFEKEVNESGSFKYLATRLGYPEFI